MNSRTTESPPDRSPESTTDRSQLLTERPPILTSPSSTMRALIIEDDPDFRSSLAALLRRRDFDVHSAGSLAELEHVDLEAEFDLVVVDLQLPDGDGFKYVRESDSLEAAEVLVITGNASVDSAVEALRWGALDYLTKPLDIARLDEILAPMRRRALRRKEAAETGSYGSLVGMSPAINRLYGRIARVSPTQATVLIVGESGTGKELVAETIHAMSPRAAGPLIPVNCGAIPSNLFESELFGHEKGSFTGADKQRVGLFEQASGGTLFLDEITEMPIELQPKLLRALETRMIQRVGGGKLIETDIRVIAATNRDPLQAIEKGHLREDLYYRLAVLELKVPPLRERSGDTELLAQHFLDELNRSNGSAKSWGDGSVALIASKKWPGNVRELKNFVERCFVFGTDELDARAEFDQGVIPSVSHNGHHAEDIGTDSVRVHVGEKIADAERKLIIATMTKVGGNKRTAADMLGISLKTLYNRLNLYAAEEAARRGR